MSKTPSPSPDDPTPTPTPTPVPAWGTPAEPPQLRQDEARNWAVAAHLSGFLAAYVALGFLGPLVVMLTVGKRSPFVRRHAVEALNFNLTALLAAVVSGVLVIVLVGIPMLIGVGLLYLVATIMAAVAASRGEEFRYPLTLRLVS